MANSLPQDAARGDGIRLSGWMADPDGGHCSMRIIEGTDPADVRNRVAFIEKTPRVRIAAYDEALGWTEDWRKWHSGCKGNGGWDDVSQGWCDQQLLALGYAVPNAKSFDESMLV